MLAVEDADGDLLGEALHAQPDAFDDAALVAWFTNHAPSVDRLWVEGRITADTVNDPGRRHLPKPRDLLFRRSDGRLERYVASRHGAWSAAGLPTLMPMASLVEDRATADREMEEAWFARRAG
jgi:hypothetical protein